MVRDNIYLENNVKKQVLSVSGVQALKDFRMSFDRINLKISISAKVETDWGDLFFSETVKN